MNERIHIITTTASGDPLPDETKHRQPTWWVDENVGPMGQHILRRRVGDTDAGRIVASWNPAEGRIAREVAQYLNLTNP